MITKICKDCGRILPLGDFYRNPHMRDGRLNSCIDCKKAYAHAYGAANRKALTVAARERRAGCEYKSWARKYHETHMESSRASAYSWRRRNLVKSRCHSKVARALKRGAVERGPCVDCGCDRAQAHHEDYSKPLDITWLCRSCHARRHRKYA